MTEPSQHKAGRRRAAPSEAARKPARRSAGGARVKGVDQVRRNRVPRLAWARTTPGQFGIGLGILVLAVVLRLVVGTGEGDAAHQTPVGPALATFGTDWKTQDGHSYEITVTPIAQPDSSASDNTCVLAPSAGRTNLRFTVRIDNRGSDPAPVPEVLFAVNLKASGAVSGSTVFAGASRHIALSPSSSSDCASSAELPAGQATIAPKSAATFSGLIGGVRTPVGAGIALIVRYTQADAASPTGSGTADVIVQFPAISS